MSTTEKTSIIGNLIVVWGSSVSKLRLLYLKLAEEIRGMGKIPHYDYDKVLKQIQHASYPASLGMINLGLYQYVKSMELQNVDPEIFFFIASVLFFFTSIVIGVGIGTAMEEPQLSPAEQQKLKYKQAYIIVIAFGVAITFDLFGLMFLGIMHVH